MARSGPSRTSGCRSIQLRVVDSEAGALDATAPASSTCLAALGSCGKDVRHVGGAGARSRVAKTSSSKDVNEHEARAARRASWMASSMGPDRGRASVDRHEDALVQNLRDGQQAQVWRWAAGAADLPQGRMGAVGTRRSCYALRARIPCPRHTIAPHRSRRRRGRDHPPAGRVPREPGFPRHPVARPARR